MMKRPKVKISVCILAVFLPAVVLFSSAQASFLDIIRALVTINPLEVVVSAPSLVETNKIFKVEARVINKGEERIGRVTAEIFLPGGLALTKKNTVQNVGAISGRREKRIQWSVKAEQTGIYIILVSATAELKGNSITAEGNTVTVTAQENAVLELQPTNLLQRFFAALQRWLRL